MRRRPRVLLTPRDVSVLALARTIIESSGSLGDAQLVDLLTAHAIHPRDARESLARLETARHLAFGASGWQLPPAPAEPLLISKPW